MKRLVLFAALGIAAAFAFHALPALADDEPGLSDGGSLVTSLDGGHHAWVDLGAKGCWDMVIRCEGAQATRYALCASSSCTASGVNQLLDYDRTYDIPVNCVSGLTPKRYLDLFESDGGIPYCKIQNGRGVKQ